MTEKRRIAVLIGSDSDLPQCLKGFKLLKNAAQDCGIEIVDIVTASIHRNKNTVLETVNDWIGQVDVIITGAGWANHLSGMVDSHLRYDMHDQTITVIGVAFEDKTNPYHTLAAMHSIKYVPGTQVVFRDSFVGEEGFAQAVSFAVYEVLPEIKLPKPKPTAARTINEAILAASK